MKKILKLSAMLLGGVAMVFGLNSCDKGDDVDCCTVSESDESYSYIRNDQFQIVDLACSFGSFFEVKLISS